MSITIGADTFTRANQANWGTASDTETWVKAIGTPTPSIVSNKGQIATPAGTFVMLLGTGTINNGDFVVRFTPSASGDFQGFAFAYVNSSNYCYTEVVNNAIRIHKIVAGVDTQLTPTASKTVTGGSSYWQHLNIVGNVASLRMWADGSGEPIIWDVAVTDTIFTTIGQYGLHGFLNNTADTIGFDSLTVTGPQNTFYVDSTNGHDTNAGTTQYLAFATFAQAESVTTAGATVYFQPGAYAVSNSVQFITTASGTPSAPILYQSYYYRTAKITSTNTNYVWQNNGDYVSIVGFEVTSATITARIGINNTGSFCSVRGCWIHDIPASGSGSAGGGGIDHSIFTSNGNDTIGNLIYNIGLASGSNSVHGVYLASGGGGKVHNNICYNNGAYGIQLWHGANAASVFNNLVFGNLYGGIIIGAVIGEGNGLNDNTTVANNIVIYNGVPLVHLDGGIRELGSTGTHNQYVNNLTFQNTAPQVLLQNGLVDTGTITTDPLLVNYQADGSGDYHLTDSSPCTGAGIATGAPTNDITGALRSLKASTDIGPYLYIPVAMFPSTARRTGAIPATRRTGQFPTTKRRQA